MTFSEFALHKLRGWLLHRDQTGQNKPETSNKNLEV